MAYLESEGIMALARRWEEEDCDNDSLPTHRGKKLNNASYWVGNY